MNNNIKKMFNVPIKIGWSVLLLLLFFIFHYGLYGIFLFLILVGSVLIHEYGHVYMALYHNLTVNKIKIFFFGAGAFIEENLSLIPKNIGLKVSLAGPGVSLILAFIGALLFPLKNNLILYFMMINIFMCLFNLLPMYPCDGGRVLYYILLYFIEPLKALKIVVIITWIICFIGLFFSILFDLYFMSALFFVIGGLSILDFFLSREAINRKMGCKNV